MVTIFKTTLQSIAVCFCIAKGGGVCVINIFCIFKYDYYNIFQMRYISNMIFHYNILYLKHHLYNIVIKIVFEKKKKNRGARARCAPLYM